MEFKLTKDEALILGDILHRISENEELFPDIVERQVLWAVEAQLDKVLVEPFMQNYVDLLDEAKNRIRMEK